MRWGNLKEEEMQNINYQATKRKSKLFLSDPPHWAILKGKGLK